MKRMTKLCIHALLLLGTAACSLLDSDHPGDTPRNGTERKDTVATADTVTTPPLPQYDTIIYAAAVRYPTGYDWRIDTLTAEVQADVVLLRNGVVISSTPASYENAVSADPDMHRIADGHIYTDYSSNYDTFIKKDGNLLFKYEGRERICGFYVDGGDVWTLGEARGRLGGVILRKNGNIVFESNEGHTFLNASDPSSDSGALHFENGAPWFCYYTNEDGPLSNTNGCYIVENGVSKKLEIPSTIRKIMDVKKIDGELVLAGVISSVFNAISIVKGGLVVSISLPASYQLANCKIIPGNGGLFYLTGECTHYTANETAGYIYDSNGTCLYFTSGGQRLLGLYADGDCTALVSCNADGSSPSINLNGKIRTTPGTYRYLSARCGRIFGDKFYMAYNPMDLDTPPFISDGTTIKALDLNGFITDIKIMTVPKEVKK